MAAIVAYISLYIFLIPFNWISRVPNKDLLWRDTDPFESSVNDLSGLLRLIVSPVGTIDRKTLPYLPARWPILGDWKNDETSVSIFRNGICVFETPKFSGQVEGQFYNEFNRFRGLYEFNGEVFVLNVEVNFGQVSASIGFRLLSNPDFPEYIGILAKQE